VEAQLQHTRTAYAREFRIGVALAQLNHQSCTEYIARGFTDNNTYVYAI
jgi:hypothetical protein